MLLRFWLKAMKRHKSRWSLIEQNLPSDARLSAFIIPSYCTAECHPIITLPCVINQSIPRAAFTCLRSPPLLSPGREQKQTTFPLVAPTHVTAFVFVHLTPRESLTRVVFTPGHIWLTPFSKQLIFQTFSFQMLTLAWFVGAVTQDFASCCANRWTDFLWTLL